MSRILKELFNGNLEPYSHIEDNDARCKNLRRLIDMHFDTICNGTLKEKNETIEKYNECVNEYEYLIVERAFCDGFSLAVRLITETVCSSEKQIIS